MAPTAERSKHVLVVRGPAQDILYDHFSRLFEGRDDVEVVKDRRRAQRRHDTQPVAADRRRAERRGRVQPWLVPPEPLS
jgi:hypothetical protein